MNFEQFLAHGGPDAKGRTLADYLAFTPEKWEDCHDHMQWAFPTRTASAYNINAPIVPDDYVYNGPVTLQENMLLLLHEYLNSVNISMDWDSVVGYHFHWTQDYFIHWNQWAYQGNHNLLRMTRVLESLGIFEMYDVQEGLYNFLVRSVAVHCEVGSKTVAFWVAAKENKLHLVR